jgi:hypothetical protein
MTIRKAIGEGARRLYRVPRVCWIWYAAATAPALLVAAAVLSVAEASLGNSAWTRDLGRNLDVSWISELAAQHGAFLTAPFPALILGLGAIFAVVYVLLLGGALEALCAGGSFFAGCGTHFWRLVRLSLYTALCAIPVFLLNGVLNKIGAKAWGDGSVETPLVYWGWFRTAVLFFLLGIVNLAFDYGAIRLVVEDSRKSWRALRSAFRLIARRPFRTIGLYLVLSFVLVLVMAAAFGVSRLVAQATAASVLLLFLFRQAAVLMKTWVWLLFYPAQAAMCESLREIPPVLEPVPEPVAEAAPPEPAPEEIAAPQPASEAAAPSGDIALAP